MLTEHWGASHVLRFVLAVIVAVGGSAATGSSPPSDSTLFANAAGLLLTWHIGGGPVDLTGPFFQPLSPSGRRCASCHRPAQGWTISAEEVRVRFEATKGLDPIFRTNDGSTCNHNIDTSTVEGRRSAYNLLIDKGLIRVALPAPADADFEVVHVDNPYGCNDHAVLSMYRRPLATTNLRFLSSLMWDGRGSSPQTGTQTITAATNPADLLADLAQQASDAASLHAQASAPLPAKKRQAIVTFEMSLATAQAFDREAGALDVAGAEGGPTALAVKTMPSFFLGINDPRAGNPQAILPENAFRLFDNWSLLPYGRVYNEVHPGDGHEGDARTQRRASIARGQVLFDQKPFDITGVAGLNDDLNRPLITGACGTCHNTPNVGSHSVTNFMNTGVSGMNNQLNLSYLPKITLRNRSTGEVKVTTDPGRALITGSWKDVGRMKIPSLRGLAARAPYFHNGSAKSLGDVVEFYNERFHVGFSPRDKQDLIAFLNAL